LIILWDDCDLIPLKALSSNRSVFEVTPIFRINDQSIGFALKYGEGEYAFTRIFRIYLSDKVLSYEDLNVAGKIEKSYAPVAIILTKSP